MKPKNRLVDLGSLQLQQTCRRVDSLILKRASIALGATKTDDVLDAKLSNVTQMPPPVATSSRISLIF